MKFKGYSLNILRNYNCVVIAALIKPYGSFAAIRLLEY